VRLISLAFDDPDPLVRAVRDTLCKFTMLCLYFRALYVGQIYWPLGLL
jgi:hypothetical protein